jgi:Fe-S cluster assembly ATP-binding protein
MTVSTALRSTLVIEDLTAEVGGQPILKGVDLEVKGGEVHVVMGPNGAGKSTLSHVLMGRPGYTVTGGRVLIDGVDLLGLPTWQRARAGLFLGMQYPIEVPGVSLQDALTEALAGTGRDRAEVVKELRVEADRVGFDASFLDRALNVDLSGGERKRNETVQLGVLRPRFAVLDEVDSGLDVDALRAVSRRVELHADRVHVLSAGRIVTSGGPELADELERTGYVGWAEEAAAEAEPTDVFGF